MTGLLTQDMMDADDPLEAAAKSKKKRKKKKKADEEVPAEARASDSGWGHKWSNQHFPSAWRLDGEHKASGQHVS